jgi:hypothetical protein
MDGIKFACPQCNQQFRASSEMLGSVAVCPLCSTRIQLPPRVPVSGPPALPLGDGRKNAQTQGQAGAPGGCPPLSRLPEPAGAPPVTPPALAPGTGKQVKPKRPACVEAGIALRFVGWLVLSFGLLGALLGLMMVALASRVSGLEFLLFAPEIGVGIALLRVGSGLKRHEEWARKVGIVIGVVVLFVIPVLGRALLHSLRSGWNEGWETAADTAPRAAPTSSGCVHDRILQVFTDHLQRMRDERHKPTLEILAEVESRFIEAAVPISAMVEKTLSDRKLHTKFIGGGGIRTWLLVSAVPTDRFSSASFFARAYPPGYAGYMDFWLKSEPLQMARQMGHDVFAHVLVYADASSREPLSVGVGLMALDQRQPDNNPLALLPVESLTQRDRAAMGL